jgi:tRNA threonylcarbamoyladenosine biosynthesis protein TsaB
MNFLAIDTSSDACSVALQLGDDVLENHVVQPREHTSILVPMIRDLLGQGGIACPDLDAIVLGNGPGSFIGMRIAASVAQGLAFASGRKIVPVSSMAAVAAEVLETCEADNVVIAQDARMNEAYLGIYRRGRDGLPMAVTQEMLQPIARIAVPGEFGACELVAAGQAWRKYPELLDLNRAAISQLLDAAFPKASFLLGLGARMWRADGAIEPGALMPAYIRERVATPPEGTKP